MIEEAQSMQESIKRFCKKIGSNRELVQGAGGNVSWKEGEVLWIKASGAWLADAGNKEIFVPVCLASLNQAILGGRFSETPKVIGESTLRPSIETLLHGLMPHKIVAHLHLVEALAILVLKDSEKLIKELVENSLKWAHVDYFKPGPDLAIAVCQAIISNPEIDVLFLRNHGIVVGGATVEDVEVKIETIITKLKREFLVGSSPISSVFGSKEIPEAYRDIYFRIEDTEVQSLALDSRFFDRITNDWALYPDHVVFLGPKAYVYENWGEFLNFVNVEALPELIFIKNIGVFARKSFGKAGHAQIINYFDVISRLNDKAIASSLSGAQIQELLNWDAEKYRLGLLKK